MNEMMYIVTVHPKFEINHSRINMMTGQTSIGFVGSYETLEEANEKMADIKSTLVDAMKINPKFIHELDNGSKLTYVNQIDRAVGCYWIKPNEEEVNREPYGQEDAPQSPEEKLQMSYKITAEASTTTYCGTIDADLFKNETYEAEDPMIMGKMICKSINAKTGVKMEYLSVGLYDEEAHKFLIHNTDPEQIYASFWTVDVTEVDPEEDEAEEEEEPSDTDDIDEGPYALFIKLNDKSSYNAEELFEFLANQEFVLREIPVDDEEYHCRVVKIDDDFQTDSWNDIVRMYQGLYGALMCAFRDCAPITKNFERDNITGVDFLATKSKKAIGCSIWISSADYEEDE
ncbi:hypothetical protein [uncultured Duncaniella sp.]|uniref:hypothetical protein n=1 Tax=uncultured Duncaniella sp. TaxID=2768039 RepID=UPI0026116E8A|nr:hypothetical protein [uncultured Duncaniella sp.]